MRWIDLRSDTVTQPTPEMREAMYRAPVGDNVFDDDPTVKELEALAADRFGKEAALFVTSGTQGNAVSVLANTARGDSLIMSRIGHIADHEAGSYALLAGVSPVYVAEEEGVMDPAAVEAAIRDGSDYMEAKTGLICIENALSNGNVAPLENSAAIWRIAQERGISVHLDGARLFNAAACLGVDVRALTQYCDTVLCCLSKGLCAPVGSVVAGSRAFVERARKWRKVLGGGLRQSGILAAAGILALTEMTGRVAEDHANAQYLAAGLARIPGVRVDPVKISMLFFTVDREESVLAALPGRMRERGIKILPAAAGVLRFVTHHDISREDCDTVLKAMAECLQ